ncbi:MAG: enoyl-CoA hydratase/isomerase family protein [Candidatus Omnitrophica bacterium]|nr:enoyl-CoA hydratase/isomerase family protein [Candidatus Omnitrophota bacterium]
MVVYREDRGVGIIEFNDPNSRVNVLSVKNLNALERIIDDVENNTGNIKGLFFVSGKSGIFIAGADIKELAVIRTKEEALELCKKGQELFNRIERLAMPSFAIVGGACVGGGMELALACDYIIAIDSKRARFSLPEINLGIIPGFGGPHRLARRIGESRAKKLMDTGEFIGAKEAKRLGIVDRIIPGSKKIPYSGLLKTYPYSRNLKNMTAADEYERNVLAKKIFQEEAKNALSSYLLSRNVRGLASNSADLKHCVIAGAGTMGMGIAYLINSRTGISVDIFDRDEKVLKNAVVRIKDIYKEATNLDLYTKEETARKIKNIVFGKPLFNNADIFIEAITEDISKKKTFLSDVEKKIRKDAMLATNTSCISIEELSGSLSDASRFLGLHFFNPAYKMKLVEVILSSSTGKATLDSAMGLLRRLDRTAIVVKDSPGFLVNRMLLPYLNEAVFMVMDGFSPEDIDNVMLEFGMPVGPLKLIKDIGPEVAYRAGKILEDNFGDRLKVPDIIRSDFTGKQGLFSRHKALPRDAVKRLLFPMKREAELCLKEKLVPGRGSVDLALILGIGYPRTKRIWTA